MQNPLAQNRKKLLWISALVLLTLIAYLPLWQNDFVTYYDDGGYIVNNPVIRQGLTLPAIRWVFISSHGANWHPLTGISHLIDVTLWGLNPQTHHAVNLLLHILNGLLLFTFLSRTTNQINLAGVCALLFLLHPFRVESVAWAAERKDVLSGLFWMLTLLAYTSFTSKGGPIRYLLTILLLALGLMAKPMLVTLPFVLLLLDYWPLQRFSSVKLRRLLLEKLPMLLLIITSSVITYIVQSDAGAAQWQHKFPLTIRLANAALSYAFYIWKTFVPAGLAAFYPFPDPLSLPRLFLAILTLTVITILIIAYYRQHRFLLVGWLWFLGTLVPVIGIVQVGMQARADRYMYLPGIGLLIIIVWTLAALTRYSRTAQALRVPLTVIALIICAALTARQITFWKDSQTLFTRAADVTTNNYHAWHALGIIAQDRGNLPQAAEYFQKAVTALPTYGQAHLNLGVVYAQTQKLPQALDHLQQAASLRPHDPTVWSNLAHVALDLDHPDQAREYYQHALTIDPCHASSLNGLGILTALDGRSQTAADYFARAVAAQPDFLEAYINWARALLEQKSSTQALTVLERSLEYHPRNLQILRAVAQLADSLGQHDKARAARQKAAALQFTLDHPPR